MRSVMRLDPSVGPSVSPSAGPLVGPLRGFSTGRLAQKHGFGW